MCFDFATPAASSPRRSSRCTQVLGILLCFGVLWSAQCQCTVSALNPKGRRCAACAGAWERKRTGEVVSLLKNNMERREDMKAHVCFVRGQKAHACFALPCAGVWLQREAAEPAAAGVRHPGWRHATGPAVPLQRLQPPQLLLQRCAPNRHMDDSLCRTIPVCAWQTARRSACGCAGLYTCQVTQREGSKPYLSALCVPCGAGPKSGLSRRSVQPLTCSDLGCAGHPKASIFNGRMISNRIKVRAVISDRIEGRMPC